MSKNLGLKIITMPKKSMFEFSQFWDLFEGLKLFSIFIRADADLGKHIGNSGFRRRSPFIPFALKNETGCILSMSTSVAAGNRYFFLPNLTVKI